VQHDHNCDGNRNTAGVSGLSGHQNQIAPRPARRCLVAKAEKLPLTERRQMIQELVNERTAILEFEAGYSRQEAEQRAKLDIARQIGKGEI